MWWVIRQINFSCALHYAWKVIHLYNFHDELGEATVCGKHRLADLGDDQYGLDHPAAAADGDPSCFWDLQQLFLANWCLYSVQLLPLLQLQEEAVTAPEHLPQQQQHHLAWLCPSNVSVLQQSSHLQYCCKGNFPASTTEKVKVYTHKIVWHYKSCKWFLQILQLLNKLKCSKKWKC